MTATATVGGVLDVERFFLSGIADETTETVPLYVAYILLAYDDIYDVFERPANVFRLPYAATVPGRSASTTARTTRKWPSRTCSCPWPGSGVEAPTSP